MINFAVRIGLETPIIIGRGLHLDGLLAAAIYQATNDVGRAHSEIPLARHAGVWQGSRAILELPAPLKQVSLTATAPRYDITPERIRPTGRNFKGRGGYPTISPASGPYKTIMTNHVAYQTRAVWFAGRGDVDQVMALLATFDGIGTKSGVGWGTIATRSNGAKDVELIDTASDSPLYGIVGADRRLLRPAPVSAFGDAEAELASASFVRSVETIAPPYWDAASAKDCYTPADAMIAGNPDQIITILH